MQKNPPKNYQTKCLVKVTPAWYSEILICLYFDNCWDKIVNRNSVVHGNCKKNFFIYHPVPHLP